jgi:hypothetical protein
MRNCSANQSRCPARHLPDGTGSTGTPLGKMIAAIRAGAGPVDAYVIATQQDVHPFYERNRANFRRAYNEGVETPQPRPAHFPPASYGETADQYLARWLRQLTRAGLEIHSIAGRVFSANERRALGRYKGLTAVANHQQKTGAADFNDSLDGLF